MKANFEAGIKVGRPAARQAAKGGKVFVASEFSLASQHILQGIEKLPGEAKPTFDQAYHPLELFARAYDLNAS